MAPLLSSVITVDTSPNNNVNDLTDEIHSCHDNATTMMTVTPEAQAAQLSPFLSLPSELRLEIYNIILACSPIIYHQRPSSSIPSIASSFAEHAGYNDYAMAFTSKFISAEFLDHVYSSHPFTFVVVRDAIKDFSPWPVSTSTLAKIQMIRFTLDMNIARHEGEHDRMERELFMPSILPSLPALRRMQAEVVLKMGWTDDATGTAQRWGTSESNVGWWGGVGMEELGILSPSVRPQWNEDVAVRKRVVSEIDWRDMGVEGVGQWTYVIS
jgi:hypothetical protein